MRGLPDTRLHPYIEAVITNSGNQTLPHSMTFGEITHTLLYEKENYGALHRVLHMLHDFYAGVTGISAEQTTDNNVFLSTGKAISPGQAAFCLLDIQRTAVFMRGIHKAILKLKNEAEGPVHILYAGCGPYATLLTPFITQFSPHEVRFHLLDVNQASLNAVEKLYTHLNARDYVDEFICADATKYQIPAPVQLVVSEAMQRALNKEPQVAIMQNLIPQLNPQSIFIPEEIRITAHLINRDLEVAAKLDPGTDPGRIDLGEVYNIGRQNCCHHPAITFQMPEMVVGNDELSLFTAVTVFEDERLHHGECSLTVPLPLANVAALLGRQVRLEYVISGEPGFKWHVLENSLENWAR